MEPSARKGVALFLREATRSMSTSASSQVNNHHHRSGERQSPSQDGRMHHGTEEVRSDHCEPWPIPEACDLALRAHTREAECMDAKDAKSAKRQFLGPAPMTPKPKSTVHVRNEEAHFETLCFQNGVQPSLSRDAHVHSSVCSWLDRTSTDHGEPTTTQIPFTSAQSRSNDREEKKISSYYLQVEAISAPVLTRSDAGLELREVHARLVSAAKKLAVTSR